MMWRSSHHQEEMSTYESSADEVHKHTSSSEEDDMLKVGEQMLQASRKRRDSRRKMIENEHMKRVTEVKAKITKVYEDRKTKVNQNHRTQWERLNDLIEKRKAIEERIFAHMKNLEATRSNLSTTLESVFAGRLEEIEELREGSQEASQD